MWFEAIGKMKHSQPGKFIMGCTKTSAIVLAAGLAATPVQSGLLGDIGVSVGIGGGSSGSGGSGGSSGGGVGVGASVGVGGVGVGANVGIGGGGVGVGANVGVGGTGVGVGVDVSLGGGVGTGPVGPGVGPGGPGVSVSDDDLRKAARSGLTAGKMPCAKDGNETAYNGFLVRDRAGDAFGWIQEATVSPEGKLVSVRLQSSGNTCYKLSNANFRVRGDEVWTNADAIKFR